MKGRTPTFGRRVPTDWRHVERYGLAAIQPTLVDHVERLLHLPRWHRTWDQGQTSSCVGHGCSMMMSILNEIQARKAQTLPYSHRYDPFWLWDRAKEIDEWPDSNPGDDEGTSVRAACDVLRDQGHVLKKYGVNQPPSLTEGIKVNRWCTSTDQMRTAISWGIPVAIGVNWYRDFNIPTPGLGLNEFWIGKGELGSLEGGHCVLVFGASYKRQAFYLHNSWGRLNASTLGRMSWSARERWVSGPAMPSTICFSRRWKVFVPRSVLPPKTPSSASGGRSSWVSLQALSPNCKAQTS